MLKHKQPLEMMGDFTRLECHRKTSKYRPGLPCKESNCIWIAAAPTVVSEVSLEDSPLHLYLIIT